MTPGRMLYSDIVPYDVPTSLESMRGPAHGSLTLPMHLWWAPGPTFDLADRAELLAVYRAIVRDARTSDQEALLNSALLVAVWPELRLPVRCRQTWVETFPELAA